MGVVAQVGATGGRVVIERRLSTQLLQAVKVVWGACGNGNEAGPIGLLIISNLFLYQRLHIDLPSQHLHDYRCRGCTPTVH